MEKGKNLEHVLKESTVDTMALGKSKISEENVKDGDETVGAAASLVTDDEVRGTTSIQTSVDSVDDDEIVGAAASSSVTDDEVQGMTSLQISGIYLKKQEIETVHKTDDAAGDCPVLPRIHSPAQYSMTHGAGVRPFHVLQNRPVSPPSTHPPVRYGMTHGINIPPSQVLPRWASDIEGSESLLRDSFIQHIIKYEGVAVPPSEEFEIQWAAIEYELEQIIKAGLIPQDSIASSGLNEDSYKDFKICAEELQNNLFEGKLMESLSNLRGFRRLFSRSKDMILVHAFRGKPTEVLQNIYYGGDGVLPEDRMILDDPFHHEHRDDIDDFMFDD